MYMRRWFIVCFCFVILFGAGCFKRGEQTRAIQSRTAVHETASSTALQQDENMVQVVYPIEGYQERLTVKRFGTYVHDRFRGYHAGDDIEFTSAEDQVREIPVVAIATGTVARVGFVSGYGGLIVIRHSIGGEEYTALYGHISLTSSQVKVGDQVELGQKIAILGVHQSRETDGERKHLHFGIYKGYDGRVNGYESSESGLLKWKNPTEFIASHRE